MSDAERLNYQGKLAHGNSPVTATIPMTFQIFDGQSGTNVLYEESMDVNVVDGYYSIELGEYPNLGSLISAIKREDAHIQVTVDGKKLKPREKVGKPPVSLTATEHWSTFGISSGGPWETYDSSDWVSLEEPLIRNMGAMMYPFYFGKTPNFAIFPAKYGEWQLQHVRLFVGSRFVPDDLTHNATVTVNIRHLGTSGGAADTLLRTVAKHVDVTDLQPLQWFDIPLTNSVSARTLKHGEVLEVLFDTNPPRGAPNPDVMETIWWKHTLIDVEVL